MTTAAIFAHGTLLQIGDGGGPESFTTIAELKSISGPDLQRDALDVTTHNSPGKWRQFIAGLKSAGEISFDINYVMTEPTHNPTTGLLSLFQSGVERNFKLVFPNQAATSWLIPVLVTGFSPEEPVDNVVNASITLTVSGTPTLA